MNKPNKIKIKTYKRNNNEKSVKSSLVISVRLSVKHYLQYHITLLTDKITKNLHSSTVWPPPPETIHPTLTTLPPPSLFQPLASRHNGCNMLGSLGSSSLPSSFVLYSLTLSSLLGSQFSLNPHPLFLRQPLSLQLALPPRFLT